MIGALTGGCTKEKGSRAVGGGTGIPGGIDGGNGAIGIGGMGGNGGNGRIGCGGHGTGFGLRLCLGADSFSHSSSTVSTT